MPEVASRQPRHITIAALAEAAGVSERVIGGRKRDGRIPVSADGEIDVWTIIQRGLAALAADQKRAAKGDGALILEDERARLAKEQADAQEMKNAVSRGDLIPRPSVVAGIQQAFASARARLLGIPTKAAPLVVGLSDPVEVRNLLSGLVHEACGELAATRALPDPALLPEDGSGGDGGDGDLGAPSEPDGERVV